MRPAGNPYGTGRTTEWGGERMSEKTGGGWEPDDQMARQSGAVSEDLQPVAPSDGPEQTAQEGLPEDTIEPPTDPGRSSPSPSGG